MPIKSNAFILVGSLQISERCFLRVPERGTKLNSIDEGREGNDQNTEYEDPKRDAEEPLHS